MTPELAKALFYDGCHGCISSNFGWILGFIIFVLPVICLLVLAIVGNILGAIWRRIFPEPPVQPLGERIVFNFPDGRKETLSEFVKRNKAETDNKS
jgi:hypothetical protein